MSLPKHVVQSVPIHNTCYMVLSTIAVLFINSSDIHRVKKCGMIGAERHMVQRNILMGE